ncbi:DUF3298 and DUF4163 domain-containing protein [Exiguobacterium artemiae]|uniref:DUF3298 and DUF4163 domain-containing protein n=1 Tax=Exiguobacterium artemiae TaxID=340145 RepID=UPI002963F511|nr:DUF3298 domain-containing protein [Exiguobacterium sibiricum]MDW2886341.1 DUF3298 domain-containing protein [Exiguobacterium sibiricum]
MKKSWLIPMLSATLLLPTTLSVDAATKPTVITKYAKDKKALKYPYVTKGPSTSVRKTINTDLTAFSKFAYQNYLEVEAFEKKERKTSYCKQNPSMCNFTYSTSYQVAGNNTPYLTFILSDYEYTVGAHGLGYKYGVNYSLKTGKEVRITSVLKTSTQFKKVEKYIYNKLKNNDDYFVDTLSDVNVSKKSEYLMMKDGIKVIFQSYAIAPYATGQPEIFVPKSVYK